MGKKFTPLSLIRGAGAGPAHLARRRTLASYKTQWHTFRLSDFGPQRASKPEVHFCNHGTAGGAGFVQDSQTQRLSRRDYSQGKHAVCCSMVPAAFAHGADDASAAARAAAMHAAVRALSAVDVLCRR